MKLTFQKISYCLFLCTVAFISNLTAQPSPGSFAVFEPPAENSSLSGRVTDASSGQPLAGASLFFPDLRTGVIANEKGEFHFIHLPAGIYILDITFQGYAARAIAVTIDGNTRKDFQLSATVAENENVVVTGVSKATELKLTPTPVSIVKKSELNRSTASNIIEALSHQAGVAAVTTGPAVAKPFIRGLGYNRVITLNDGMRQEGQQWGDEHGIEIDEYSVQRAEIVKGPASLIYGSDAIGGVLNIQSAILVPERTISANISTSYNGNNNLLGTHMDVAGKINSINFSAYASTKDAGDYQNAFDGYVLNSRFKELNYGTSFGINRSWGYSHASISYFDQHLGVIEGDRDVNGKFLLYAGTPLEHTATGEELKTRSIYVPSQQVTHFKIAWDNSIKMGKGMFTALLGYQRNQRREFGDPTATDIPDSHFDLQTVTYNLAYHLPENAGWKTTVGASGMQQQNTNRAEEALIPDYSLLDAGAYLLMQKKIGNKFNISGGARLDNRHMNSKEMLDDAGKPRFEAYQKDFTNLSASFGAAYAATKSLTIKANISRGFRAPSVPELSSNGEHEGTNRYEIGDRNLRNETSLQADLGLEYAGSHLTFNVTPFFNHINNFIFLQKLLAADGSDSLITNDNGDLVTGYHFDQQDANLAGLEFNLDVHPHPLDWLHLENTVSLLNGRFTNAVDGSKNLPMIAPAHWVSELRGEWSKPCPWLANLYFRIEMDANARQNHPFTGFDTETETPGYTLFNAGFGTDFVINGKKWLSLNLSLNNLTDKSYQSHLSRLKYTDENLATSRIGVFNMGRNFTARVILPMEFKLKDKG